MKKFFTLILVLAAALTASATNVYLATNSGSDWFNNNTVQLTEDEPDKVWSADNVVLGSHFAIFIGGSSAPASWDNFNGNTRYGANNDSDKPNLFDANKMNSNSGNAWGVADTNTKYDITITKNGSDYELYITDINKISMVVIFGSFSNWQPVYLTETNEANVYSATISGVTDQKKDFKLTVKDNWIGGGQTFQPGVKTKYNQNSNGNNTFSTVYDSMNVYYNVETEEFWYEDAAPATNNYYVYYTAGAVDQKWQFSYPIEFTENSDGLLEAEIPVNAEIFTIVEGKLNITSWDDAYNNTRFYPQDATANVNIEEGSYTFTTEANHFCWQKVQGKIATITLNVAENKFDVALETPAVSTDKLYMIGKGFSREKVIVNDWKPNLGVEGIYVSDYASSVGLFNGFIFNQIKVENSAEFHFTTKLSEDWNDLTSRLGSADGGKTFSSLPEGDNYFSAGTSSSDKNFNITTPGEYLIMVDPKANQLYLFNQKTQTGVEEIEFDANQPAVYYNLQGMEVANPTTGLYIVRQGNKTFKLYVR